MKKFISIVIPNYNGSSTIGTCLEAALKSGYECFEVVVVDDCSTDGSVEIIARHPCRLIRLTKHAGASAARNKGAENSRGDLLFFTDADCLIREDALSLADKASAAEPGAVIGGTYTPLPYDSGFFSAFQSIFIHYSETRKIEPDYIATHAMVVDRAVFKASGGFKEDDFFPILEDVEFCHRLRGLGMRFIVNPQIQVMHVFNFTFIKSIRNAFRKSLYWTAYSLGNRDLLADSGTASVELKINGLCLFLSGLLALFFFLTHERGWLVAVPFVFGLNLFFSRRMIGLFYSARGPRFTLVAALYYTIVYPLPVIAGGLAGVIKHALIRTGKKVNLL